MDNQTFHLQQNRTICSSKPYDTINSVLNVLLFFGFPTTTIIIVKLLKKVYKTRSFSAAELFLLQINFTNVSLFISLLLLLLDVIHADRFFMTLYMIFNSPTFTARPIFILAISVVFYLAIVHPVTYMTIKTWHHWEWLVITLTWLYSLALNLLIFIFNIFDYFNPFFVIMFFIKFPLTMFFNIATLRALSSNNPRNGGSTLNLAKRKAFRIILSILVVLLLFYMPRAYIYVYPFIAPTAWQWFQCSEEGIIMMLPTFSEIAMPVIFLYSVRKLDV